MVLTSSRVPRTLVLFEADSDGVWGFVQLVATIALACCTLCRSRRRVLPCDVLPRKLYALGAIERLVSAYAHGDGSLRQVAWRQLGPRTPAHTTLHGWSEGLGAHALGRRSGDAGGAPFSRFVAEAEAREPEAAELLHTEVHPDPCRYRSEGRLDRLVASVRACLLATHVADLPHPRALARCRCLALRWSRSSVLEFPSRISCTAFEHPDRSAPARSRSTPPRSRDPCRARTKSPCGGTSRSPS